MEVGCGQRTAKDKKKAIPINEIFAISQIKSFCYEHSNFINVQAHYPSYSFALNKEISLGEDVGGRDALESLWEKC